MKDKCFLVEQQLKVAVVYVHVPNCPQHASWGHYFCQTYNMHPPGMHHEMVVAVNGGEPTGPMKEIFKQLGPVTYFHHDDSGWDIGAYQAFSRQSPHDMVVFCGGSTYIRRAEWLARMVECFTAMGGKAVLGSCGNLGDKRSNVSPHIRTTGFWTSPELFNLYPIKITSPAQRYPFEHGQNSFTQWFMGSGVPVVVADFDGIYHHPAWNDGPNGYHRGDQRALLIGDRLTAPPYYTHP
jgi:hypothetical protein